VYADVLERVVEAHCPMGCNHFDNATMMFDKRRDCLSNFRSMAAHRRFDWDVRYWVAREDVLDSWQEEFSKYNATMDDMIMFLKEYDPFVCITRNDWNDEFHRCLAEVLAA
jgi:hypothetical protein